MEGGLDYPSDVIISESLGFCDELEKQIAYLVGTYECERKTAVEYPEKLMCFRQFVNSDQTDANVVFVAGRE